MFLVGLSIIIIYPISIKGTLTDETYRIDRTMNKYRYAYPLLDLINPERNELDFVERREAGSVGHFFIFDTLGRTPLGEIATN